MSVKLTDRFLASRKAPACGRTICTDSTVPGLTFRVSAPTKSNSEGRRDWLLRYRPRRQAQKAVALGAYPVVSLSMARQRAGAIVAASIALSTCGHGVASKAARVVTSSRNSATSLWAR
jgi:hypothetical protein